MKHLFHSIFLGLLLSCTGVEKPEKPANLIAKSTMVDIFTDSYLSNAARSISSKDIREKGIKLDSIIFKKYNIDSLQFAQSNAFYATDLNSYSEIFQQVEAKILKVKEVADSLKLEDKKLRPGPDLDSLEGNSRLGEPLAPDQTTDQDEEEESVE